MSEIGEAKNDGVDGLIRDFEKLLPESSMCFEKQGDELVQEKELTMRQLEMQENEIYKLREELERLQSALGAEGLQSALGAEGLQSAGSQSTSKKYDDCRRGGRGKNRCDSPRKVRENQYSHHRAYPDAFQGGSPQGDPREQHRPHQGYHVNHQGYRAVHQGYRVDHQGYQGKNRDSSPRKGPGGPQEQHRHHQGYHVNHQGYQGKNRDSSPRRGPGGPQEQHWTPQEYQGANRGDSPRKGPGGHQGYPGANRGESYRGGYEKW